MLWLELGLGRQAGGYGVASAVLFWLQNVLSLVATVGADATFSRGGSPVTVPAWDAVNGVKLITTAADGIASPYMRHDAGAWHNDDGAGNPLHPTNAQGVFLLYPAWVDAEVVPAGSYRVDFVGVQAKYYLTVAGGTTSGTGVVDDTGVIWVLQGNYSNGGGGTLPGLLSEPTAIALSLQSQTFNVVPWDNGGSVGVITPNTTTAPDGTLTADTLGDNSAGGTGIVAVSQAVTFVALSDHVASVYAKEKGVSWVLLFLNAINVQGGVYFDLANCEVGSANTGYVGTIERDIDGFCRCNIKHTTGADIIGALQIYASATDGGAGTVPLDGTSDVYIWEANLVAASEVSSPITTTAGAVQRNASAEANPHVIAARFVRYRVTETHTETHLTDATNSFDYDGATTTLTFTDGVTTLSTVTGLEIGDTIVLDQVDGKLYVNGALKDTDGALAPTWAAITGIGNITDLIESVDLDPTDTTWDK